MHPISTLYLRAGLYAVLALTAATVVRAEVTTTISGFGTVGGSFTSDRNYAYIHDTSEFNGATNQLDVALDSRVGLQAVFDFGSGFSVTAQEVARLRGAKAFDPGTEWLYVQYAPNSDWKLRVGRVALAVFLYSDSKFVGYAAPWFHAPNEVYGVEPFNYLDGGEVVWHKSFGQLGVKLQGAYGSTQIDVIALGQTFKTTGQDVLNAAISFEYGNFLVRLAETNLSSPVSLPLSATYTLNYTGHDTFKSAGIQYDDGQAIVLGEYSTRSENNAPLLNEPLVESSQWYAAGGWRFGKFTPLVVYGVYNSKPSIFESVRGSFASESVSLRYDVASNVALKAQVSRAKDSDGSYFADPNPDFGSSRRVNVFSLGADFVF